MTTDAGLAEMQKAWPVYAAGIQSVFSQYLTEDDAEVLERVLAKMSRRLR